MNNPAQKGFKPKEFEKLLCQLYQDLVPTDFTVTHNEREIGNDSEGLRQLDMVIHGKIGPSSIKIVGEAKYWNKRLDSGDLDKIMGKYVDGDVQANKIVVFSNNGFTGPFVKRAKKKNIDLLEPTIPNQPKREALFILAVGNMNGYELTQVARTNLQNRSSIYLEDYRLFEDDKELTIHQKIRNLLTSKFNKEVIKSGNEPEEVEICAKNVLYKLKQFPHSFYNGDFFFKVSLDWFFIFELSKIIEVKDSINGDLFWTYTDINPGNMVQKFLSNKSRTISESISDLKNKYPIDSIPHLVSHCITIFPVSDQEKSDTSIIHNGRIRRV